MHARIPAAGFAAVVLVLVATAPSVQAQQADAPGCNDSSVQKELPTVGDACGRIIANRKARVEARVAALLQRGVWHNRAGRRQEAKRDIDDALQLAPEHAELLQIRAGLHLLDEEIEAAQRLAKKSAEIEPNRSSTFQMLGRMRNAPAIPG